MLSFILGASTGKASGAVFLELYHHVLPKRIGEVLGIPIYNFQFFQVLAVILMVLIFGILRLRVNAERPGFFVRIFKGWVLWIRDEMVYPVMGEEDGRKFLPYFLFLFFFIAFMNLLGLFPHGITATGSIFVTGALAVTSLFLFIAMGMKEQGALGFFRNLVPHGIPLWLWPLMFIVEILGIFVKPFALMIRLFANMTAGHLVILSFIGLIFFFAGMMGEAAYAVALPSVLFAVFIMIIESFVALLQAYIFTILTIVFTAMYMHPEH